MSTPTQNPNSEFRRIAYIEGLTRERFYQIGQFIGSEEAYVYSIDDTSYVAAPTIDPTFIRRFSMKLINEDGVVRNWYSIENPTNCSYQANGEEYVTI